MFQKPKIGDVIERSDKSNIDFAREIIEFAIEKGFIWDEDINDSEENEGFWSDLETEAINYLNNNSDSFLFYCYWGIGQDGKTFGLYPCLEDAKENCEFVSSRPNEWPGDDYEGCWLHINCHGNVELYYRREGTDASVWSVV